jgi:hypothetical protein
MDLMYEFLISETRIDNCNPQKGQVPITLTEKIISVKLDNKERLSLNKMIMKIRDKIIEKGN